MLCRKTHCRFRTFSSCRWTAVLLFCSLMLPWMSSARDLAPSTVVLYNRNDVESRDLAKYYAEKRGIPFRQVLGLDVSSSEEISRQEYIDTIQTPLTEAFTTRGWWILRNSAGQGEMVIESTMRYLVILRGVPLKVAPAEGLPEPSGRAQLPPDHAMQRLFNHNESSVDSELAALFDLRNEYPGIVPNPYYRRFSSIFDVPPSASPMLVGRLDGPDADVVRSMIDGALEGERRGVWGWAVVDSRGITSGPYLEGDQWLREAATAMRKQGIPVVFDGVEELLPDGFPMPRTAVYYGWYAGNVVGPFADAGFRFVPGAIAAHIHSFSAVSLRNPSGGWTAPLVMRGAAVSLGNVYEPYLSLTTNLDIFQERLQSGFTVGEAAYMAVVGLSWMNVVVGDPLYQPYAAWSGLRRDVTPEEEPFIAYRDTVLAAGGDVVAAAPALRELATKSGNSMFLEGLAEAQMAAHNPRGALMSLDSALELEKDVATRFRLTWQKLMIQRRIGDTEPVVRGIAQALGEFRDPAQQRILDALLLQVHPPAPPQ